MKNRELTEKEELLVELVHLMSFETGMTLKEVKHVLQKPISHKNGSNCLECLDQEGKAFVNELILYLNSAES